MTLEEFNKKYRISVLTKQAGWGVDVSYVIYDNENKKIVHYENDAYGQFIQFKNSTDAVQWIIDHEKKEGK